MKKFKTVSIFLMAVLFMATVAFGATPSTLKSNVWNAEQVFKHGITAEDFITLNGASIVTSTAKVFFVRSTTGANTLGNNQGLSWEKPFATVDYAINQCTASRGDTIIVLPYHAESFTAADGFDADVAGINIIGIGKGDAMPTFTFADTDATVAVGAADVTFKNLAFKAGISDIVIGISVEAAGDNFTLDSCYFPVPSTATFEFLDVIDLASGADGFAAIGNVYRDGTSSAANHFIEAGNGVNKNMRIIGNDIQGRFAVSAIWSDAIDTGAYIADNVIRNDISGQHAIEFTTTANGMIVRNVFYTDTYASTLDPGSMYSADNIAVNSIDLSAVPIPALPAIGTVTAGSADDILKKMYYTSDGTDAYPATVANDSTLAKIMAKGSTATANTYSNATDSLEMLSDKLGAMTGDGGAGQDDSVKASLDLAHTDIDAILADTTYIADGALPSAPTANSLAAFIASGGTALGTELADSKSIVDAIGTNGTTVADTATGIAGMIGVNDSNNAMDTSTVVSNPDGSVYERQEYVQKLAEILTAEQLRSIAGSAMPLAVWYVDANIAASGAGTSPATAFKTMQEAITACSNSVDDWVLVFDYSGGDAATITINKSFVHIIGNAVKGMPYPRIKPTGNFDGITITEAGDRVEIANMVIGGGTQSYSAITFSGGTGSYGVYIHDNVICRDADAPCLYGVYVPSGTDAPYLYLENNMFYGSDGAGIAAAGSAIRIAGNMTRGNIVGNYIQDVGRTATPAIWLDGSVTNPRIENNRIKTDTDTGTGGAITLGAGVDDGWINGNVAANTKAAPANNPFVDAASTNGWGINYVGVVATVP